MQHNQTYYPVKTTGDTRDPFLVEQLQEARKERNQAKQIASKHWHEINAIATYLGCYGHSTDIIRKIEKYKKSHHQLENMKDKNKIQFLIGRFYNYLIRKWAW